MLNERKFQYLNTIRMKISMQFGRRGFSLIKKGLTTLISRPVVKMAEMFFSIEIYLSM